jgi:hypothetical protein
VAGMLISLPGAWYMLDNDLEPLYSKLAMAKVYTWSYYRTELNGPILIIDRLEDFRIVEWYTTM